MTTPAETYTARRLAFILSKFTSGSNWVHTLTEATEIAPKSASLRKFIESLEPGTEVELLQVTLNMDGAECVSVSDYWEPGARSLTSTRASSFALDGSTTDYAGMSGYRVSDTVHVAVSSWGSRTRLYVYRAATASPDHNSIK